MTPLSRIRRRRTEEQPADPFPVPDEPSAQEAQQLTAEVARSIPPPPPAASAQAATTSIDHTAIAQAAAAVQATTAVPAVQAQPDAAPVAAADQPAAEEPVPEEPAPSALRRFGRWAAGRSVAPAETEAAAPEAETAEAVEAVEAVEEPTPEVAGAPATRPRGPSARDRGRLRRRIRYLRRARELGLRDLGGLMFDQYRFRSPDQELLAAKLAALHALDSERRALEHILGERRDFDDLREPGIAACPHCGALHSSDAKFCEVCGTPQSEIPPPPADA